MPLEEEHRSWRNPNGVKGASLEAHGQEYAYQGRRCMFDPLGWEDPLEKEMATRSTILAWETPWSEEPGRLYSPWGRKESDTAWWVNDNSGVKTEDQWQWSLLL